MSSQAVATNAVSADIGNAAVPDTRLESTDWLAQQLCAVARADRIAFDNVYMATVDRALHLVTRIVGDSDVAEDVVSDVYFQVWQQANRFDPTRGAAIAWILTMCRNRALDALRRRSVAVRYAVTYENNEANSERAQPPDDLLIAVDDNSLVHNALSRIAVDDRQLLALAFFRGYTHQELAAITGQPLGTIKSKIRRTLAKLKELLRDSSLEIGEER
ncbi:MAG: sigma-70 family RNA polymerase sigma factor [Pseudomonadota bacterium]